ncbi:protein-disulfide reductase DsbD family protein [Stakelama saccharophila]|uniref:Protein-disulfide reductase DsbD family protein n=1 Tax=Stakelama saccharophila TaxID=3075605 RepID=A0ABZ0BCA3_9SPHN|nr:thioredoxin family protein [Stakelama sp. W311]WNO54827.1 protein-disulfide reductase DsbD family protein [Stakelama sp. W311]
MTTARFIWMTVLAALASLVAVGPAAAQIGGQGRHIAMQMVPETSHPAPASTVTLAFVARPEAGWHGYWKNPGEAGVPTTAHWTLPDGVTADSLQYPVPQTLMIGGIMNYVYEGPFTQFAELHIPEGLARGTELPVTAKLDYLVCTHEICVPESRTLSTVLTVGDGAVPADRRARFDRWRKALPKPLGAQATYQIAGDTFRLSVPFPQGATATDAYFFPETEGAAVYSAPQTVTREGDRLIIATKAEGDVDGAVTGVLKVGPEQGFVVTAEPGTVAADAGDGGSGERGSVWTRALIAFFGAVLGGLILNIMPCVFPILSLKALNLARAGETQAGARAEALAYTAGVVLVCVVLGAVLLALRAAGVSAGWAFQLQDPRVILFLLLLVTGIAFNLAGLFELSAPGFANRATARGSGGAFATGALAAFVATPCTGPFMGVALGAALVLPAVAALAIFAGLGLGLALPFLLIGFVPRLRAMLPKPGAWMETFRHILSVPMFLTALALAWVLGRQAGVGGMTLGLGAALLLALGLWWTGRRQMRGRVAQWAPALIAALVALGGLALVREAPAQAKTESADRLGAEPFSEQRLADLRAEGRPVFAYFTADWCLTCKVNEKAAIETQAVADAFAKANVAVLVGDWTDGDPELGRFIERHNRAGVPLYLWYDSESDAPRVLPQILTRQRLTALPGG